MTKTFRLAALAVVLAAMCAVMQAQDKPVAPTPVPVPPAPVANYGKLEPSYVAGPTSGTSFSIEHNIQGPRITLSADSPTSSLFVFSNNGRVALQISKDGSMKFGEGVTPTQAAKEFAEALKELWPSICPAPKDAK